MLKRANDFGRNRADLIDLNQIFLIWGRVARKPNIINYSYIEIIGKKPPFRKAVIPKNIPNTAIYRYTEDTTTMVKHSIFYNLFGPHGNSGNIFFQFTGVGMLVKMNGLGLPELHQ